jgi:hypothetical protein
MLWRALVWLHPLKVEHRQAMLSHLPGQPREPVFGLLAGVGRTRAPALEHPVDIVLEHVTAPFL